MVAVRHVAEPAHRADTAADSVAGVGGWARRHGYGFDLGVVRAEQRAELFCALQAYAADAFGMPISAVGGGPTAADPRLRRRIVHPRDEFPGYPRSQRTDVVVLGVIALLAVVVVEPTLRSISVRPVDHQSFPRGRPPLGVPRYRRATGTMQLTSGAVQGGRREISDAFVVAAYAAGRPDAVAALLDSR